MSKVVLCDHVDANSVRYKNIITKQKEKKKKCKRGIKVHYKGIQQGCKPTWQVQIKKGWGICSSHVAYWAQPVVAWGDHKTMFAECWSILERFTSLESSSGSEATEVSTFQLAMPGVNTELHTSQAASLIVSYAKGGQRGLRINGRVASALCCWVDWRNNEPHWLVWFPLETAEWESDPHSALAPTNPICSFSPSLTYRQCLCRPF